MIKLLGAICCVCLSLTALSAADGKYLHLTLDVVKGSGDDPMFVIFLENKKGFVKTLYWFSRDDKWFEDLTLWEKKRKKAGYKTWKDEPGIDAVIGPTIAWGKSKSCKIPIQQGKINILDGTYRMRIEQRKDKGGHYKNFKLPLKTTFKGGTLENNGYIKKIEIKVKEASKTKDVVKK